MARARITTESGVRPKQPSVSKPTSSRRDAKLPKSVHKTDQALARLGKSGIADWDRRKQLLAHRTELGRRSDNEATRLRGTVEVSVDDPDATRKTRRNMTRCRQSEAFRHNRLSGMQRDAWREMALAWQTRTVGLGPSRSKYGIAGGGTPDVYKFDQDWKNWCASAIDRRVMVAVVIDCIVEPKTLAQIERDHRLRRGQALDQFILGLDLWAELRGWMRGPRMQSAPHLLPDGVTTGS